MLDSFRRVNRVNIGVAKPNNMHSTEKDLMSSKEFRKIKIKSYRAFHD